MRVIVKFICFLASSISFGFFNPEKGAGFKSGLSEDSLNSAETGHYDSCQTLLNLEREASLTPKQVEVGTLVHEIIEQIASNPLEYCEALEMQAVIEWAQ